MYDACHAGMDEHVIGLMQKSPHPQVQLLIGMEQMMSKAIEPILTVAAEFTVQTE